MLSFGFGFEAVLCLCDVGQLGFLRLGFDAFGLRLGAMAGWADFPLECVLLSALVVKVTDVVALFNNEPKFAGCKKFQKVCGL